MTETQKQVVKWLATGHVGTSSKCMAMWLAFGEQTTDRRCPADPDDLDRCLKLLDQAPGLRPLIPQMTKVSEQWARLVPRWDEVEASHLAEVGLGWTKASSAPKTYDLMASILRPQMPAAVMTGCAV
jgi:hypothetical protein